MATEFAMCIVNECIHMERTVSAAELFNLLDTFTKVRYGSKTLGLESRRIQASHFLYTL